MHNLADPERRVTGSWVTSLLACMTCTFRGLRPTLATGISYEVESRENREHHSPEVLISKDHVPSNDI